MAGSISEYGHAKNVENFADLINFCTGYGAAYNPSNNLIKLPALSSKLSEAKLSLKDLNSVSASFIVAINTRQQIFEPLNKLVTRILNALDASGAHDNIVQDVRTYVRKIHGNRASKPKVGEPGSEPSINSVSQMSFDMRLENFSRIIALLEAVPSYTPNEPDLQIASLKNRLDEMRDSNSAHSVALVAISNSRNARNIVLYNTTNGIVSLASEVKKYVKSVYGFSSPELKQINALKFKII